MKKDLKVKISVLIVLFLAVFLMYLLKIPCIFKAVTGLECLGCGMTRAVLSALKLDFKSAFSYHIMFWSVPLFVLLIFKDGRIFKNKHLNLSLYILLGVGFLVNYFI